MLHPSGVPLSRTCRPHPAPQPQRLRVRLPLAAAAVACLATSPVRAQEPPEARIEIADLDLEQLAGIQVTSASRRLETVSEATSAIFVISQEDIRRSGVTSLPEALRLAPALQVVRLGAQNWTVTSRGFADFTTNKLLVLIDGRAIYSPLFSGVFWDVQLLPVDDIERIEVIRGPGGTLWGSNAVNGVINVITKAATATQGGLLAVRSGTAQHVNASARYGFRLGERSAIRFYGTFVDREPVELTDGTDAEDSWRNGQGGFRLDLEPDAGDRFTFQGDVYASTSLQSVREALPVAPFARMVLGSVDLHGVNALARWTRRLGDASELQIQAYFDREVRDLPPNAGRVSMDIADLELHHRLRLGRSHDVVWGAGYRIGDGGLAGTFTTSFQPPTRTSHLFTAHAQDHIALVPERWYLTLGAKVERNDFSGLEVQPNLRARWVPAEGHTIWSAVSRAVRIPSRIDTDIRLIAGGFPTDPPTYLRVDGSEDFESEELIAAELGYRGDVTPTLSLDLAMFYGWYDRLRSFTPQPLRMEGSQSIQPFLITNEGQGESFGGTLTANWRPTPALRLLGSYTRLGVKVSLADAAPAGAIVNVNPGFNPKHQGRIAAFGTLPHGIETGVLVRYVGRLSDPRIDEYVEADARIGWSVRPELSLALVGQDLLRRRHAEFAGDRLIPRRAELHLTWQF